jgi:putative GTP pyrophosphokinase
MNLSTATRTQIKSLVEHYKLHKEIFDVNASNLAAHFIGNAKIRQFTHSVRFRVKDPSHLTDKLQRKAKENNGTLNLTKNNLFSKINDLAGVRILHLHTQQMGDLKKVIEEILDEQKYRIIEGPIAHTWDDESRSYFEALGIKTKPRESLYTSVHYVLKNNTRTPYTCELQVRTLMEEVWGEVSHKINYPHECLSVACQEQLKVLARVTSAGSRLVDSLFSSHKEFENHQAKVKTASKKRS